MRNLAIAMAAAAAAIAAVPAAADTGLAAGAYECWHFGSARLLLNFTVTGPDSYAGYDGTPGNFEFDPSTGEVVFISGPLHGIMPDGFKAVYEVRDGVPTLSYISARGAEAAFCQNV
jgi:hypothetical protein